MKQLFIFTLCFLSVLSYAQEKNCKALLKEKMDTGQPNVMTEKIKQLTGCGLDSVDVMLVNNNTLISTFIVKEVQEKNSKEQPSYNDFVQYVNSLKAMPAYQQSKNQAITLLALKNKTASLQTWDQDTKIFTEVGYSAKDLGAVKQLLKDSINKGWSYQELFNNFNVRFAAMKKHIADSSSKAAINMQLNILEEERRILAPYCDTNKIIINNFYLPGFTNYEDALACARKAKRPMLLYFNGKNCANCRRMEGIVFNYEMVREEMRNYILTDLSCDDETMLPTKEQQYSKALKKQLKTEGDKNAAIEATLYKADTQPYFVILDDKGNELAHKEYTGDWMEYYNFLKDNLKIFLHKN
ncbi:MAG: hypothetical protein JSS96_14325 [Bacteroidetes bacterium]|nr:hypothetical protein [Bacteroidota bacterium]